MTQYSIRVDQVTQVRGFADQRLRKKDAPLDPSNRRISLIVQYLKKPPSEAPDEPGTEGKSGDEGKSAVEGKPATEKPASKEPNPASALPKK